MNQIFQNPYRTIGTTAEVGQRVLTKQNTKINALLKIGREISFSEDIVLEKPIERNEQTIRQAFSRVESAPNRVFYALFWFVKNTRFDEIALNHLYAGDYTKAVQIWESIAGDSGSSLKSYSAYNNLGTLKLALSTSRSLIDVEQVLEGIRLKIDLICSDAFSHFCESVTDSTYLVDSNNELRKFLSSFLEEMGKNHDAGSKQLPSRIARINPEMKAMVAELCSDEPMEAIKRGVEQAKTRRKKSPKDGLILARQLYKNTKGDLASLKDLLGIQDLRYQSIADSLAKEILQCGIDFFMVFRDQEDRYNGNLGEDAIRVFKLSSMIAVGFQTKEKIKENIQGLQEWIDESTTRKKQALIKGDLDRLVVKLSEFQEDTPSTVNVSHFVSSCKPLVTSIGRILGKQDEFYLKLSSAVVSNALGHLVQIVNQAQESDGSAGLSTLFRLRAVIPASVKISSELQGFDMEPDVRSHFVTNFKTLKMIEGQISASRFDMLSELTDARSSSSETSHSSSQSEHEEERGILRPANVWWILGLIGVVIGLIADWGWGAILPGLLGVWIGSKFTD